MKVLKKITLVLLGLAFTINLATAQNYKAPTIDASGKIHNKEGKFVGSVNKKGEIMDTSGVKIASVDGTGTLIDTKTGKKLGKAEKNGNYVPYISNTPDKGWTTSAPMNGTCLVKDKNGNIKGEVHENYKQFGACALHCMENNMNHDEVLDKSSSNAVYACPMHPEVVSNKPGKCSKCGMDLKKK